MLPVPHTAADALSRLYQSVPTPTVTATRALSAAAYRLRSDDDAASDAALRVRLFDAMRLASWETEVPRWDRPILRDAAGAVARGEYVLAQTTVARMALGVVRSVFVTLVDELILGRFERVTETLDALTREYDFARALRVARPEASL